MYATHTAILLATYNGEPYLRAQLDSLFSQTDMAWQLYIHDDGSTDNTAAIVAEYAARHDNIVVLDYPGGQGAMDNFFGMLSQVDASYYLFCDQDDVWKADKVEQTRRKLAEMEQAYPDKPLIAFTDLCVTDKELHPMAESFFRFSGIYPQYVRTFGQCAATPITTGCTMMFNRKAVDTLVYPSPYARMHDEWLTLCVLSSGGHVEALPYASMYYRQHGGNTLGAMADTSGKLLRKLGSLGRVWQANKYRYQMLRSLGYGSPLTFVYNKLKYKYHVLLNEKI